MIEVQNKSKVLIVTNMYPNEENPNQGIFIKEQVDSIKKLAPDLEVDLLHIKGRDSIFNYLKAIFHVRRLVKEKKYNLIHAHYGLAGLVSIFQKRVPVICTFHGSDVLYVWWQKIISKALACFIKHSIAVSESIAKKLPTTRVSIIPCGVNISLFKPIDKEESRRKLNLKIRKKYLLFPGNPKREVKNYPLFKKILELLKKDFQVEEIILNGFKRTEVKYALNSADLVLITSKSEASNMVLKEALACNTPVVSIDVGDAAKQLKDLKNCEVTSSNPEDVYRAVYRIFKKEKIEYSYREKISYLSSKYVAKRIIELYKKSIRIHE